MVMRIIEWGFAALLTLVWLELAPLILMAVIIRWAYSKPKQRAS